MSEPQPERAPHGRGRLLPYLLIGVISLLGHGFILTNDGVIWDSWYTLDFLETRNWATTHDFFNSVGIPLFGWLYHPFAFVPHIVESFMFLTVLCLVISGILTYHLSLKLGRLTRGEALALTLLAQAMPTFSAAQDFVMFMFVFMHTLFLTAALLAATSLEMRGRRRSLLRALSVLLFLVSFSNAALLVFYGAFYLLLFFRFRHLEQLPLFPAVRRFLIRYPDFLLLPPVCWLARGWLTPQYGWYESYNNPTAYLPSLVPNFLSFFTNAVPYHLRALAGWPGQHPLPAVGLAIAALLVAWKAPPSWRAQRGPQTTVHLLWFGVGSLLLAVLPFAAAGKWFSTRPLGELSRHCILTGLPLAVLALALLRVLFSRREPASRWFAPVTGYLSIVLASQLLPVYVHERAEWIYSRAVVSQAARLDEIRTSSVIVLQGYSVVQQNSYALYGVASSFGDRTRLFTKHVPSNRRYFTPSEIETILMLTTFLPGDFRRIDPSGRQLHLVAKRLRGPEGDGEVVSGYLKVLHFGTPRELDQYLASLVELRIGVLKPATPFIPASVNAGAGAPAPNVPAADFTNGLGMRMVRLPEGWWAGKFETTQAHYQRLMSGNPSLFVDPARPADSVSWLEAMDFCRRLTAVEAQAGRLPSGFVYRLPTVREFDRYSADTPLQVAVTSTQEQRWQSAPVGSLPPNRLGLHDAIGNLWEWCLDWGDRTHRFKVSRGGSWVNHIRDLSPYPGPRDPRDLPVDRLYGPQRKDYPDQGFWDRGFRCVLAPPVTEPDPPPL